MTTPTSFESLYSRLVEQGSNEKAEDIMKRDAAVRLIGDRRTEILKRKLHYVYLHPPKNILIKLIQDFGYDPNEEDVPECEFIENKEINKEKDDFNKKIREILAKYFTDPRRLASMVEYLTIP